MPCTHLKKVYSIYFELYTCICSVMGKVYDVVIVGVMACANSLT